MRFPIHYPEERRQNPYAKLLLDFGGCRASTELPALSTATNMLTELDQQLEFLQLGKHVCPIYENQSQRLAISVPFVVKGLAQGESCFYIADEESSEHFMVALAAAGVDVAQERERHGLCQLSGRKDWFRLGEFSPPAMIELLQEAASAAKEAGFAGLRIAGEMSWVTGLKIETDQLIEYERLLNEFSQGSGATVVCQYDRSRLDAAVVNELLRMHPVAIVGEQVCPNPFFEHPRMVFGTTTLEEQVDWKLAQLQRAHAALRVSERSSTLLRAVVEGTTDAVFVKDRKGRYLMINSAGARFLGKSVEDVVGKDDLELFTVESARPLIETERRLMADGVTETCEELVTAADIARTFLTTKGPYRDNCGNVIGVIGIARDITHSKQIQVDRDRLLQQLQLQIERLPVAYIVMDGNYRVLDWNPAAERMFGFTKEEVVGKSCLQFLLPATHEQPQDLARRIYHCGNGSHMVIDHRTKDARLITCEWFNTPLPDLTGKCYAVLSLVQDVTESKRVQKVLCDYADNLQTLSRRVIEVQEEERRRLARELHDEIGQVLSIVSVNLRALQQACDASAGPRLQESTQIVDNALIQVRNLALNLRPAMLDDLGLIPTLRWHADQHAQRAGFILRFAAKTDGRRLTSELATTCYRIVQEALTNIVRHAQAREVWLEIQQEGEQLRLTVQDDGVGLDLDSLQYRAERPTTVGVRGMRERAELLSGTFQIKSELGKGTIIHVRLPLSRNGSSGMDAPAGE